MSRQHSTCLLDVSCAAQRFLLSVLPLSSDTSPRAVCEFCEALHTLNLGRVTTEGMIVGILRKLETAVGITDQMVLTQYFALESSTPDQCARVRICVERLVRTHAAAHPAVAATLRMTDEYLRGLTIRPRRGRETAAHLAVVSLAPHFASHRRAIPNASARGADARGRDAAQ